MSAVVHSFNAIKVREKFVEDLLTIPSFSTLRSLINDYEFRKVAFDSIFLRDQFYEDDNGFFVYRIPEPVYFNLYQHYLFLEDRHFNELWYMDCNNYVSYLPPAQKYILSRYTRHGDEVVNTLLRDPDGFSQNPRIHDLLFNLMPSENNMLYAVQLIDRYDPGNYTYFNQFGEILSSDHREIEEFETLFLDDVALDDNVGRTEKLKILVYDYINDLRKIIRGGPVLPTQLQVFRACQTDYLNDPFKTQTVKGFLSTTLDVNMADDYRYNNYIYQITLRPGTHCLSIKNSSEYYSEFEILVDMDAYAMPSEIMEKHCLQNDPSSSVISPEHIMIAPMNPVRNVRHIQLITKDTSNPNAVPKGIKGMLRAHGGRAIVSKTQRSVRRSVRNRSKRQSVRSTRSGIHTITRSTSRSTRSPQTKGRTVRKSSKRVSKKLKTMRSKQSKRSKRLVSPRHKMQKPLTRSMKPLKKAWAERDHAAPLVVHERVPDSIHTMLLQNLKNDLPRGMKTPHSK